MNDEPPSVVPVFLWVGERVYLGNACDGTYAACCIGGLRLLTYLFVSYRGKYATVRRCRDKRSGKQYAAKFLRKRRRNADLRPEILHEVAVLEACTYNSRIVNLYKVFETSNEMILLLEL